MKWMYNTLTGGKIEMLPFWWILAFWKKKGAGRAVILWKTKFVFDCVGAQHRQDVYCTCKGISPPLLWGQINARIRLLPRGSNTKIQWQLRWIFLLVLEWKKGWRLKLKETKTSTFPLCNLFLPFSLLSLTLSLLSGSLSLTQSTVGLNNIHTD